MVYICSSLFQLSEKKLPFWEFAQLVIFSPLEINHVIIQPTEANMNKCRPPFSTENISSHCTEEHIEHSTCTQDEHRKAFF